MNLEMPTVMEETKKGEKAFDLYARLVKDRIVFLNEEVTRESASSVIAQLLYLDNLDSEKDIKLYINSPGGSCYDGFAIIDTMDLIKADVQTVGIGLQASMAAIILACGAKGKRSLLPSSRVMIHEPSSWSSGKVTDMQIDLEQAKWAKRHVLDLLNKHAVNQSGKWNEDNIVFDRWFSPEEAIKFNLVDKVLEGGKM